jgi:cytochrome P450
MAAPIVVPHVQTPAMVRWTRKHWAYSSPFPYSTENIQPKPPHSFFFGHLKVMGEVAATMPPNMHPQAYLTAIAQKYDLKGIFYLDLWPIADSQVILTDPELMNHVTLTKPLPMHPMADDFLAPIVGRNSIATSNGPVWKRTHNAMAPAFSWSHIRTLTGMIADETMLFRGTLDRLSRSGETFSLEETAGRLIFDVIARIVFNFSLHAQTRGSSYLDDLREMIKLAEAQLSWSPFVKVKTFFRRQIILRRLHSSITRQIKERLRLLRSEGVVPSRKDPYSILDLMLREKLREDSPQLKGRSAEDLAPEYLNFLLPKYD